MTKDRLVGLIKLLISFCLLFVLFRVFDFRKSYDALRSMDLALFAIALALFQLSLLLRSFRWRFLLDAVDVRVPIPRLLYLYYVGVFFNTFLPSGFGGDAIKMYELARYSSKGSEAVGTVFVDRLAGIIVLFIMGLLAWPFTYRTLPRQAAYFLLLASSAGLIAIWVFFQRRLAEWLLRFFPDKFRKMLQSLYDAVHTCGTRALWKALAVSSAFNVVLFGLNYFIALSMGVDIPFIYFVAFMPVLSLAMLLPSVGALGTRESAYLLLFGTVGVSESVAIAMSLAFYLVNVLTGLVGGLLYSVDALRGLRASRIDQQ